MTQTKSGPALRTAAIEIEDPQHDRGDARAAHRASPVQRLVGDGDEKVIERLRAVQIGSASDRLRARSARCDRNSTRSQTSSTSTMSWLVHNTPQRPLSTTSEMPARMSRAADGSIEAVGRPAARASGGSASPWRGEPRLLAG